MKFSGRQFCIKTTNLTDVESLIRATTEAYGFSATKRTAIDGEIRFSATRIGQWVRFFCHWLLQRVEWTFRFDENVPSTVLTYDRRWFVWFRILVAVTAVPVAYLWCFGFRALFRYADESAYAAWVPLVLPWVGIISMMLFARCVLSIRDSLAYIDCVREDLRAAGFMLDALPNAPWNRVTISGLTLLGYAAIATVPIFFGVEIPTLHAKTGFHLAMLGLIILLLVLSVAFLVALFIGIRRYGADDRFAGMATSLHAMMVVLFFLAAQLGPHLYGVATSKHWANVKSVRALTVQASERAGQEPFDEETEFFLERARRKVLMRLWFPIGLFAASWIFALGYALASVRTAALTQRICRRLQTEAVAASTKASTTGRGFLRIFRIAHGVIWLVYVVVTLVGLVSLIIVALSAFGLPSTAAVMGESLGAVHGTTNAVALLLGLEPASGNLQMVVHLLFVAWASILPLLTFLSVLDLVRRNCRTKDRLAHGVEVNENVSDRGAEFPWLEELKHRAGICPPSLVLTESRKPVARVHGPTSPSKNPLVEISRGVVQLLSANELRAIVAHEFAHSSCGHTRTRNRLQWLGRLTLVGDTFVGTLEDGFGYELEADRVAIERFRVPPSDLRAALVKLQVASQLHVSNPSAALSGRRSVGRSSTFEKPWRAIRTWLALYTGDPPVSYWHPALQQRLEALEAMTDSTTGLKE